MTFTKGIFIVIGICFLALVVKEFIKQSRMAPDEKKLYLEQLEAAKVKRKQNAAPRKLNKGQSKKQRISNNKANAVAGCPKCGSTDIMANQEGYNITRALLLNPTAGLTGKRKIKVTCLYCKHRWTIK